jgi:catechol 2,3-dioxygenase-like lactoylglutathione lyase family enzyme
MSYAPAHFACWFEIPVTDLEASLKFYAEVFQMDLSIDTSGPNPMVVFPTADAGQGVSGHLYPGTPSENGPTIHLVVPDTLDAARARLTARPVAPRSAPTSRSRPASSSTPRTSTAIPSGFSR